MTTVPCHSLNGETAGMLTCVGDGFGNRRVHYHLGYRPVLLIVLRRWFSGLGLAVSRIGLEAGPRDIEDKKPYIQLVEKDFPCVSMIMLSNIIIWDFRGAAQLQS